MGAACIRTDVRTLLAFVILTASAPDVAAAQSTWCPELGSYSTTSIKVTRINNTAIAHVCGSSVFSRQSLTKWNIPRVLDGFPPWYRKSVKNKDGVVFAFPIGDIRDVPLVASAVCRQCPRFSLDGRVVVNFWWESTVPCQKTSTVQGGLQTIYRHPRLGSVEISY